MTDDFNKHFIDSVPATDIHDNTIDCYLSNHYENVDMSNLFKFKKVSIDDVEKATRYIKSNVAGVDNVSPKMLKLCRPFCLQAITFIINSSIEGNIFPDQWKRAIVIPVAKNTSPELLQDFRPISLLSVLSKVMERIIYLQFTEYLTSNGLLPPFQSGFRAKLSTVTVLTDIIDDYLTAINQSQITTTVLLDYSKAFDSLNHNLLLAKLSYLFGNDG